MKKKTPDTPMKSKTGDMKAMFVSDTCLCDTLARLQHLLDEASIVPKQLDKGYYSNTQLSLLA